MGGFRIYLVLSGLATLSRNRLDDQINDASCDLTDHYLILEVSAAGHIPLIKMIANNANVFCRGTRPAATRDLNKVKYEDHA